MKSAFCIAGSGSGVGKTTITIGLLRALKKRGLSPAPFKCGPDYIDPGFHKIASGTISRNLDTWMMGKEEVKNTFAKNTKNFDVAIVEGVMGLFDGAGIGDITGSTAHVAKILNIPVLLVVNARGIAGTIAPLVKGFIGFKEGVNIVGIIANNVGSERHAKMLSDALDQANLPPLLGFLPRDNNVVMPERHLGLVPVTENKEEDFYDILGDNIEKYFQIDKILDITQLQATRWTSGDACPTKRGWTTEDGCPTKEALQPGTILGEKTDTCPAKLGIALDDAFHFYYEDNLDMLREAGIDLIPFSPISDSKLPEGIQGIIIGGGFPECFSAKLAENTVMKQQIANFADAGGFIYAECGGLMYLSDGITTNDGHKYSMCGIIPIWTKMENKLRTLGYREIRTIEDSPLGPKGTIYRGHEFHWSSVIEEAATATKPFCEIRNARKSDWEHAGYRCKNVFASYIHAHFASNRELVKNVVQWCKGTV